MTKYRLISKNKLLKYLADLALSYSPAYEYGNADKYEIIKGISDDIERWRGDINIVEYNDSISRESVIGALRAINFRLWEIDIPSPSTSENEE